MVFNSDMYYKSTDALLGSKQQQGRKATILTPLARCGPIFANVASTEVLPPSPKAPIPASFTLRVISFSNS